MPCIHFIWNLLITKQIQFTECHSNRNDDTDLHCDDLTTFKGSELCRKSVKKMFWKPDSSNGTIAVMVWIRHLSMIFYLCTTLNLQRARLCTAPDLWMCESLPQDLTPASKTAVQKHQTETLPELHGKEVNQSSFLLACYILHIWGKEAKRYQVQIIFHKICTVT